MISVFRFAKKAVMMILVLILVFLIIGFISEKFRHQAIETYAPPGDFTGDGQTGVHYIKKGDGDQTVVFSSGNGTASPYADMYHLQKEISADAESIIYERPGYGWSEATTKSRSIDTMTDELGEVLAQASDNESFIFVAHSMASLEILNYAQQHPKQVNGIILLDGVHPEYASEMDPSIPFSIHLTKFLKNVGGLRLLSNFSSFQNNLVQNEKLPEQVRNKGVAFSLDRMWNKTMLQERKAIPENGKQVKDQGDLGDIPMIVFSAKENPMEGWKPSQDALPDMSVNAEQIWIDTKNHFVHHEKPELVVEKIKRLLDQAL